MKNKQNVPETYGNIKKRNIFKYNFIKFYHFLLLNRVMQNPAFTSLSPSYQKNKKNRQGQLYEA